VQLGWSSSPEAAAVGCVAGVLCEAVRKYAVNPSQECRVVSLHAGYWVRVPVRQQCADSVVFCTAQNSAWRLCIGRIRGPGIIREMLSRIDKAMSHNLPFV